MRSKLLFLCVISGALLITGCSGDPQDDTGTTGNNTAKTATFYGYISQSSGQNITVSDGDKAASYNISAATITSDSGGIPTDLNVGMMVTVGGASDSNNMPTTAETITYDSNVEGSVVSNTISVTDNSGEIDVMGQIVVVDDLTMYDTGIVHAADIAVGTPIEVSGVVLENGNILAKYIELKTDYSFEIKGLVSMIVDGVVDVTTFNINDCVVNITDMTQFHGLDSAANLTNGMEVNVKVAMDMATFNPNAPCPVAAESIELVTPAPMPVADTGPVAGGGGSTTPTPPGELPPATPAKVHELHGLAEAAPVDNMFNIEVVDPAGVMMLVSILITDTTIYEGGMLGDIVAGTPLNVVAIVDDTGAHTADVIIIHTMEIPVINLVEVVGMAAGVPVSGSFDVIAEDGTMTSVMIMDTTMFKGGIADDIMEGTKLVVKGHVNPDTMVLEAGVIMLEPTVMPMDVIIMEGTLDNVDTAANTVTVLGQVFMVTDKTVLTGFVTVPPAIDPMPVTGNNPNPAPGSGTAPPAVEMPPLAIADLVSGDTVVVVSHRNASGALVAMHIQIEPMSTEVDVMVVSMVEGALTIVETMPGIFDYSVEGVMIGVGEMTKMPMDPVLADSDMVVVIGNYDIVSGILAADNIERQ